MKKALLTYLATASAALAHAGHGEPAGHWITRADHIAGLIVVAVVGVVILTRLRSRE